MKLFRVLVPMLFFAGPLPLLAQSQAEDKDYIRLNEDAVRMIQFDFSGKEPPKEEMKAVTLDKPWLKFKTDVRMPRSLTDTTKVKKPTSYVRAEPYTIWTKFGEDPVYDVLVLGRPEKWKMHWTLNPKAIYQDEYGRSLAPGTGLMYTRAAGRAGGPAGAGAVIGGLDFMGFLYNNLSARGRMLAHNRKHANAWKTYQDYRPTREDSLKFPTYNRLLPIYDIPTDSNKLARPMAGDSLVQQAPQDTLATPPAQATPDEGYFSKYIRQRQSEDSIRRQEFLRKDKARNNSYDLEKEIRRLKENK